MKIYHGSENIISKPQYGGGRKNNDFGKGFYCTENIELAKEWAVTSEMDGFVNSYYFDISGMNVLHLNSERYTVIDWIAILVQHRLFRLRTPIAGKGKKYLLENFGANVDAYDVVIGYRADDAYFDYADAFLNNGLTVSQLAKALRLGMLGEQLVVKSQYAFDELRFIESTSIDRRIYYPLRKSRNDNAMREYLRLSAEDDDGLYLSDIIRERIGKDDERISGILY